jgi:hypothetical protein
MDLQWYPIVCKASRRGGRRPLALLRRENSNCSVWQAYGLRMLSNALHTRRKFRTAALGPLRMHCWRMASTSSFGSLSMNPEGETSFDFCLWVVPVRRYAGQRTCQRWKIENGTRELLGCAKRYRSYSLVDDEVVGR